MDDASIGPFWQRIILATTHTTNAWPILVFLRLQKYLRNPYAYWTEIIACLIIDLASTFHHLCGDQPITQHLVGYNFCISDKDVLTFTDQMWASSVINIFAMYGPDICDTAFVKLGWAIAIGMNASIAFYDTSDSIRYSWWAIVFVLFCIPMRLMLLKRGGGLVLYWKYHINMVDLVAGLACMMIAYASKGTGDTAVGLKTYYSLGHGIWQAMSLGAGMGFWANSSSMHYSLIWWKRKTKEGQYYIDIIDESGYDVNLPVGKHGSDHEGIQSHYGPLLHDEERGNKGHDDSASASVAGNGHGFNKWQQQQQQQQQQQLPYHADLHRHSTHTAPILQGDTEPIELLPVIASASVATGNADPHTAPPEALLKVLKTEGDGNMTRPAGVSKPFVRTPSRYATNAGKW